MKLLSKSLSYAQILRIKYSPFYRTYRYKGELSFKALNDRGAIDHNFRIFYNRIPKSANSTISARIVELRTGERLPQDKAKGSFVKPADLSASDVSKLQEYFKFTFVRSPFSRTLSAYLDTIVSGRKRSYLENDFPSGRTPSFTEFLECLQGGALYRNAHWAPQVSVLSLPVSEFDFIGRFENLDEDWSSVARQISGSSDHGRLQVHGPSPTRASERLREYFDRDCVELVRRLFRSDFEAFGYDDEL